jgi:hypothetical protein
MIWGCRGREPPAWGLAPAEKGDSPGAGQSPSLPVPVSLESATQGKN